MKKALFLALASAASFLVILDADNLKVSRNRNLHPGLLEFVGNPNLQRNVEPKVVCASNNTQLCLAIGNDYRGVDATTDLGSGFGETVKLFNDWFGPKSYIAALPDAWIGLYRSSNGVNGPWHNGQLPGFPGDTSALGMSVPWRGLTAGTDGALATDGVRFYGAALIFNRGGRGSVVAFRLTAHNDESPQPIRWDPGFERIVDSGESVTTTGLFADLPSMVFDIPRPGKKGTPACGNVYIGYTMFAGAPTGNSFIKVAKSGDCLQTVSNPIKIQGNFKSNQRVVMTVDQRPGTPKTTGGGTVYAFWRNFPNKIIMSKSLDFAETWSTPVDITALSGPVGASGLCTYDAPTVGTTETSIPDHESARALGFASPAVGLDGKIHLVWTERVDPATGLPLTGGACTATAVPKIVYTSSSNGGLSFTQRRAFDRGIRCETGPGFAGPRDFPPMGGGCPAGTTARSSGAQIQPSISHNAGKLIVLFSEGRANPNTQKLLNDDPSSPSYGFNSGRDTQVDIRVAQIDPANGMLLSSVQMSRYTVDAYTGDIIEVPGATNPPGAKARNRMVPHYKGGTTSFKGDHDDITPAETLIFSSPPHFATADEVPGTRFIGIFGGDTRETLFPGFNTPSGGDLYGDWRNYDAACDAGVRNSNNYAAYVGGRIEAYVHQSFKPLSVPAGAPPGTVQIQRSWVVTVRNHGDTPRAIKLALNVKSGLASLDQFPDGQTPFTAANAVTVIGNNDGDPFCTGGTATYPACTARRIVQPDSSMTFTVFGRGQNAAQPSPVEVKVFDSNPATPTTDALAAIVRLNPNPENPSALAGINIAQQENHGPNVQGPFVHTFANPTPGNPTPGNPTPGNPTPGNPTPGNPTPGNATPNPAPSATGFSEYTDYQYVITAQDANTVSAYSAFANIADAEHVDDSHVIQMIISRTHGVPTLVTDQTGCHVQERADDEVISAFTVPEAKNLAPTPGNPTPGNPTPGNPTPGNPTPGNNTFAVGPASVAQFAASPAAYRATAIASAFAQAVSTLASSIGSDGTTYPPVADDQVVVTFRFAHCDSAGGCGGKTQEDPQVNETVPRSCDDQPCGENEAASNLIGFVTIAEAADANQEFLDGDPSTIKQDAIGPDLAITSPATVAVSPSAVVAGDMITLSAFTVTNQGEKATGSFETGAYLSSDMTITADDRLAATFLNGGLGAGGFSSLGSDPTVTVPAGTMPGFYFVGYLADRLNQVGETDEFDNFVSAPAAQLTVCSAPVVGTASPLPNGTSGQPYNQSLSASGGVDADMTCGSSTFSWSTVAGAGSLPPGLSLSSAGVISGTPTAFGTYNFSVRATDETGHTAIKSLSITVVGSMATFLSTDFASAGARSMRGIGTGTIALTLPETATDIRAFLYWHGPTNSSDLAANASVNFNGTDITGTNIGISNDNLWGFANSQAYRADVTSYVNVTTTSYALTNFRKTTADGVVADINGASLLVFYQDGSDGNNRDVYLKDGNDSTCGTAGVNSLDGWDITMGGVTVPVPSGKAVRLELHVSDGQNFDGDDDGAMLLNGTQFLPAGENFDGRSISPFTDNGLWDIRSFFVTSLVRADTNTLTSPHNVDCLSAVVTLLIVEDEVIVEEVLRGADWDLLAAPAVEHRRKTSALTRSDVTTSIGSSVLIGLR